MLSISQKKYEEIIFWKHEHALILYLHKICATNVNFIDLKNRFVYSNQVQASSLRQVHTGPKFVQSLAHSFDI